MIFGHFCTSGHYWRGQTIALKLGNMCYEFHLTLYTPAMPRPGASRSIVLAALRGIVAMPSLVVLAGCLAGYAETVGYVWPADAQSHGLVDKGC